MLFVCFILFCFVLFCFVSLFFYNKSIGWLARATLGFMLDDQTTRRNDIVNVNGDGNGNGNGNGNTDINQDKKHTIDLLSYITGIVTLGTPHISPKPGCMDITRGALR